jgi:hypothetical protein
LTIPHTGATSESTYFVAANVLEKRSLFQVDKIARLFIEILLEYRTKNKNSFEYERFKAYIWQNPVKRGLTKSPEEYPYSSANPTFSLDPAPQRLKPILSSSLPHA